MIEYTLEVRKKGSGIIFQSKMLTYGPNIRKAIKYFTGRLKSIMGEAVEPMKDAKQELIYIPVSN